MDVKLKHAYNAPMEPAQPIRFVAKQDSAAEVLEGTRDKIDNIRSTLLHAYTDQSDTPWAVAYSGGKDSTLLLHLVFEAILSLSAEQRRKEVHVIANDTLVESPLLIDHLRKNVSLIQKVAKVRELPITARITQPTLDQTFFVSLIGKGYMPPTRNFRWCTDKMKIAPTLSEIEKLSDNYSEVILLLGTRRAESNHRARNLERRGASSSYMNPHDTLRKCKVFTPIVDLSDDEVWASLLQAKSYWGSDHREMITIYRNARGGECPTVLSKADVPSCGSTSPRFGCWTCTVVNKDRSLEGLIDSGYEIFEPLADFRNWLAEIREIPAHRMPVRRSGAVKFREDGSRVYGPFKMAIRKKILARVLALQAETGRSLISQAEVHMIKTIWKRDKLNQSVLSEVRRTLLSAAAA